jgi:hypothetical protein
MNSLKYHSCLPRLTLLHPEGEPQGVEGWSARRAGGLWLSLTPLDTPTPNAYGYAVFKRAKRWSQQTANGIRRDFLCCLIADRLLRRRGQRWRRRLLQSARSITNQNEMQNKKTTFIDVWQAVAMDFLKHHSGMPCPYPSTPCGWATPETVLWLSQEWPVRRTSILRPSSTPLDTPHIVRL